MNYYVHILALLFIKNFATSEIGIIFVERFLLTLSKKVNIIYSRQETRFSDKEKKYERDNYKRNSKGIKLA